MIAGTTSPRICAASKAVLRPASTSSCRVRSLHYLRPIAASPLHAATSSTARQKQIHQSVSRRNFTGSRVAQAALASHPPAENSELLCHPTPESLRELEDADDFDIDLVPLEEAQLQMTERAAEQLRRIATRENDASAALRIAVESGGCHGYQYKMELAKERRPDDYLFSHPTVKPSNILVDAVSLSLLKGSVVDFATELIGSSFRIAENPQAKGSGCGCGVSWELKV